jgi:MFS family permease
MKGWYYMDKEVKRETTDIIKNVAFKFVMLFGVVSLFSDMTHEGARSITGPFLATLGASGSIVGIVSGFGEFMGYAVRLLSGYLTDKTGKYWVITFIGYAINLLAVPALALAGHWEVAAILIIAERAGRAIRIPARDAMLSYATSKMGRGMGFGIHEAMDQLGATLGPLIITGVVYIDGGYRNALGLLLIPAILALSVLTAARFNYPRPRDFEVNPVKPQDKNYRYPKIYWLYLAAVVAIAVGYADFPLISYHFNNAATVTKEWIPLFYAIAMGVDGAAALAFGRFYDQKGFSVLVVAALLSAFFAPLVFLGGFYFALIGMVLWGIGMGAQESIMRAAIADIIPADRRGSAYGIFNTAYGVFWFIGSALMGILYDISIPYLVIFSVAAQLVSVPLLLHLAKSKV